MKPIKAIYRHGRLYDLTTNQSINLREEVQVILIIDLTDHLNPDVPDGTLAGSKEQQQLSKEKQVVNSPNDGAIQIVACVFHYDKILVINELRLENVLIMAYTSLYYSLITVVPKS